jgi:hypothetical protein
MPGDAGEHGSSVSKPDAADGRPEGKKDARGDERCRKDERHPDDCTDDEKDDYENRALPVLPEAQKALLEKRQALDHSICCFLCAAKVCDCFFLIHASFGAVLEGFLPESAGPLCLGLADAPLLERMFQLFAPFFVGHFPAPSLT